MDEAISLNSLLLTSSMNCILETPGIDTVSRVKATITWEEFQRRKDNERRVVLERAASRIESGWPSHYNLDLDMLPIIYTWSRTPFSFTIESCSGTPSEHEHREGKYSPVNGFQGNPYAYLYAHSYMAHPLFNGFREFLEDYLSDKADIRKSQEHGLEGFEGIYLHIINLWVPEEVQQSADSEYLDRFWKEFHSELKSYVVTHCFQ
jgi:hypothetical protein